MFEREIAVKKIETACLAASFLKYLHITFLYIYLFFEMCSKGTSNNKISQCQISITIARQC